MSKFSNIKKNLSNSEWLERELNLKQLQINGLLNITQAINNNVKAEELFKMYNSFLGWEMGVKKMALYVKKGGKWRCATSLGIKDAITSTDISDKLSNYERIKNIKEKEDPFMREFDLVVPVSHKNYPIAFAFIGGFDTNEDMYNKVQFIITITNIIAVAIENKRLFKRQLEQERLNNEMELASEMQQMLVPAKLPENEKYAFGSIYKPHMGVGGDYFDVIEFEDGNFGFCIADISGKGVAAALLMANFQANFHTLIRQRSDLAKLLQALNRSVNRITLGERFITFFVAEFDFQTRTLKYVNAGHNPPVLIMNEELHLLDKGCTILGSFDKLPDIEIGEVYIPNETMILSYTDGLTDLKNENGEFLGEQILYNFAINNYNLSPKAFNDLLMERIEIFKGEQNFPDDFTVLSCKIFNPNSK